MVKSKEPWREEDTSNWKNIFHDVILQLLANKTEVVSELLCLCLWIKPISTSSCLPKVNEPLECIYETPASYAFFSESKFRLIKFKSKMCYYRGLEDQYYMDKSFFRIKEKGYL